MDSPSEAPIFVIGTHRSGTTLLGRALGHHPDVAYWEEPRHIWSRGNNFKPDDVLTAAEATAKVKARVRRAFERYVAAEGRPRVAEKTPSNCLRLPFILEIFPAALFVHICRDARAVIHSAAVVRRAWRPEFQFIGPRLLGTPFWEWPALIPRAWRTLGRMLFAGEMAFWGPQPPGWRDWLGQDPRIVVLAKQWRYTVEPVLNFRARVPAAQWLDVRYEEFVRKPREHARKIQRFARLTPSSAFEEHMLSECRADRVDAWREHLDAGQLAEIRSILEPPLERLGYEW